MLIYASVSLFKVNQPVVLFLILTVRKECEIVLTVLHRQYKI